MSGNGQNGKGNENGRDDPVGGVLMGWLMSGMTKLPGLLSCRDADAFLFDYVEGALPPREARTFERHIWLCRDCGRYLDAYRAALNLGRNAFREPDADATAELPEEIVTAIMAARDAAHSGAE